MEKYVRAQKAMQSAILCSVFFFMKMKRSRIIMKKGAEHTHTMHYTLVQMTMWTMHTIPHKQT